MTAPGLLAVWRPRVYRKQRWRFDLAAALAKNDSRFIILASFCVPAVLAFAMFFSWIMLVNGLRIPFYLYYERTVFLIYVDRFLDPIVWLASSALAVILVASKTRGRPVWYGMSILISSGIALGTLATAGLLVPQLAPVGPLETLAGCVLAGVATIREAGPRSRTIFAGVFLLVLSLLVLPAELGSLLYYVLSAFRPTVEVGKSWELLEMQLWYTGFPLIPFLYVAFLFSWAWAPLALRILPNSIRIPGRSINVGNVGAEDSSWLVAIAGYVFLAILFGYYPYFHDPSYPLVGTDIYWRNALPAERVVSSSSWLAAASRERHPFVVLSIAVVSNLFGLGIESLLRFAYVGLILAFGGVVFVLVFLGSRSKTLASFSALMVTVSAPTAAGIYTGTMAEWIALIVWILSLTLLAVNKENGLRRWVLAALGLGFGTVVVAFLHPWTWIAMMLGLVVYSLIVAILRLKGALRDIGSILAAILFNLIALTLSWVILWETQGWRVGRAFSLVQEALGSKYFGLGSWEIVVFFSQIWSQFLNPVVLILAILGILVVVQRRNRFAAIVLAWLVAACVANIVAAPVAYDPLAVGRGETQIFRAMFLAPFQIPTAAGFLFLKSKLDGMLGKEARSRKVKLVVGIVIGVVFMAILNGGLRAIFPLLTDPHNYPNPFAP